MPYVSQAQLRYFNANRAKLEAQGVDVDEWNKSSKGKKLPKKVHTKKTASFQAQLVAAAVMQGVRASRGQSLEKSASWDDIKSQLTAASQNLAQRVQSGGGQLMDSAQSGLSQLAQRVQSGGGQLMDSAQSGLSQLTQQTLPWRQRAMLIAKQLWENSKTQAQRAKENIAQGLQDPNRRMLYAMALGAGTGGALTTAAELASGKQHKRLLSSALGGAGAGLGLGLAGSALYNHLHRNTPDAPSVPDAPASPADPAAANSQQAMVEKLTAEIQALPVEQRAARLEELRKSLDPTMMEHVTQFAVNNPATSAAAAYSAVHPAVGRLVYGAQRLNNQQIAGGPVATTLLQRIRGVGRQSSDVFQMADHELSNSALGILKNYMPALSPDELNEVRTRLEQPDALRHLRYDPQKVLKSLQGASMSPAVRHFANSAQAADLMPSFQQQLNAQAPADWTPNFQMGRDNVKHVRAARQRSALRSRVSPGLQNLLTIPAGYALDKAYDYFTN